MATDHGREAMERDGMLRTLVLVESVTGSEERSPSSRDVALARAHLSQLEAAAAEREALKAECERLRGETMCDACVGTGKPISGGKCMCNGTGKAIEGMAYLRSRLASAEKVIEEMRITLGRNAKRDDVLKSLRDNWQRCDLSWASWKDRADREQDPNIRGWKFKIAARYAAFRLELDRLIDLASRLPSHSACREAHEPTEAMLRLEALADVAAGIDRRASMRANPGRTLITLWPKPDRRASGEPTDGELLDWIAVNAELRLRKGTPGREEENKAKLRSIINWQLRRDHERGEGE